jgi:hypothetical protein
MKASRVPAHRNPKPDQLCQRSSDQRGFRIITESQTVADSGRYGEDIFQRAAKFDRNDILTRVNAKSRTAEDTLQTRRAVRVVAANDGGGGEILCDFDSEVRAG